MVDPRPSLTLFWKIPQRKQGGRTKAKEGLSRRPKQLFKNQLTVYDVIIIIMILVYDSSIIIAC